MVSEIKFKKAFTAGLLPDAHQKLISLITDRPGLNEHVSHFRVPKSNRKVTIKKRVFSLPVVSSEAIDTQNCLLMHLNSSHHQNKQTPIYNL